ncbi:T9SS type A sorting domain-containing protein [Flavobacterium sp.]|uniref:T9SS type A sorting domain-containing protein n=1 Tax=Flavobacterium sp. TaxID=239 RepID=UPI0037527E70
MNTLYRFFKTQLFLIVLLSASFGFAQVVVVPANCNVVVPGIGGSVGFGSKVGNGGVVTMPDPFIGGIFTYVPGSTIITGWSLLGDLSISSPTVNAGAPFTSAGAFLQVKLDSYNKSLRLAEQTSPSSASLARSKGRVTVSYSGTCGGSMFFDVYKTYANSVSSYVPPIIGPDCLLPNTQYSFSVDQIASDNASDNFGFDQYYWKGIPLNVTNLYYSADFSSVSFKTGPSVAQFDLTCFYGRANPWDSGTISTAPPLISHTTFVTKSIGAAPILPGLSPILNQSPLPNCIATGTTNYVITIPAINLVVGYTYLWTSSNAVWNLTQSGTQGSILTINNFDNNPSTLTLTITNGSCTPSVFNFIMNRTLAPALGITAVGSGLPVTCINAATSYSLPQNALSNQTNWTISPVVVGGPTVANGVGSGSTCTVTPGTVAGQYSLIATAKAATTCTTTSTSILINIRTSAPTINTASPKCVIRNGGPLLTYTCAVSSGASGYTWTFPTGWVTSNATNVITVAGSANNTVTVTAGGTAAAGIISVIANGATGASCNSATATYNVNYSSVTPVFASTNTTGCLIAGATTAYVNVTNIQNYGNYTVTSNPVGITSSGVITGGTNLSLTIPSTLAAGTYSITVVHNNVIACGTATATLTSLVVGGSIANWAAGFPSYDITSGGSDVYRVNSQPLSTSYQWYSGPAIFTTISALTIIPSPGTNPNVSFSPSGNQMTLYGNTLLANPQVYCIVTPPGACPTIISAARGTHGTSRQVNTNVKNIIDGITISPNPNNGNFCIKVDNFIDSATAILTDISGKEISKYNLIKGENKIQNERLIQGIYFINLLIDGKQEIRQIIIK